MDDNQKKLSKRKYRILYFVLNEMVRDNKILNLKLECIINDHKLRLSNPSLIAFKQAFQNVKKLNEIDKKEILIQVDRELSSRLEYFKSLETSLTADKYKESVEELKKMEKEAKKLENQLKVVAEDYTEEAIDYIDNYASKFKSVLDINQLNYDLNQLQNVMVKTRLEKAENTFKLYGDEDRIKELKQEREQLLAQLKQLTQKEQKLSERKRLIEKMDEDLVETYKNLKNNYKITEWVMNTLEK